MVAVPSAASLWADQTAALSAVALAPPPQTLTQPSHPNPVAPFLVDLWRPPSQEVPLPEEVLSAGDL